MPADDILRPSHDNKELKDYWNHREEEKRNNTLLWILAVIGAVAAVAAIAYAVYRYMTPDYLDVRRTYGVNVVGVKEGDHVEITPDPDVALKEGMILMLIGSNEALERI